MAYTHGRFLEIRDRDENKNDMFVDVGPPVRLISIITLICSILDLFADVIMCLKLGSLEHVYTHQARTAIIFYYIFTAVSAVIFVFEVIDCVLTIKHNKENERLTPIVKSLMLVFEETPLPLCLIIIVVYEESREVSNPARIVSYIKLISLVWGIVKFMKFKCCWICTPCLLSNGFMENVHTCCTPQLRCLATIVVNICHALAILFTIINIILSTEHAGPIDAPTASPLLRRLTSVKPSL